MGNILISVSEQYPRQEVLKITRTRLLYLGCLWNSVFTEKNADCQYCKTMQFAWST